MTSYIDHKAAGGSGGYTVAHSWAQHTTQRLEWLYGPNHEVERRAMTQADIAAWRNLGSGRHAA